MNGKMLNWAAVVIIFAIVGTVLYGEYVTHVWVSTSKTVQRAIDGNLVDRGKLASYLSTRADEVAQTAIDKNDLRLMCNKNTKFLLENGIDLSKTCNVDIVPIH